MDPPFRGLALGLSRKVVEDTLQKHGLKAKVRVFRPLATLALGMSRKALLERADIPAHPYRYDLPVLLGLWAVTAGLFVATSASFLDGFGVAERPFLVLATLVLATVSLGLTVLVARRPRHPAVRVDESLKELPVWAVIADPMFGVVVTLLGLLLIFVLWFIWLPILLLLLGAVSLGGLWNAYRACLVVAQDDPRVGLAGHELLIRGAVLSRTWDAYLDPADTERSAEARTRQARLHRSFVAVGLSTLAFAILVVLSRAIRWEGWTVVLIPLAGLIGVTLLLLLRNVRGRALLRQRA